MSQDDSQKRVLVSFLCPQDLAKEISNIAYYNFIERTDVIILAAQAFMDHLDCYVAQEIQAQTQDDFHDSDLDLMQSALFTLPLEEDDE